MQIKKFTASSMKEALLKVKHELGDDAMILKTRKLPASLIPMGGKESIEVTAAIDNESTSVSPVSMPELAVNNKSGLHKSYLETLKTLSRDNDRVEEVSVPTISTRHQPVQQENSTPVSPVENKGVEDSVQIMKLHDELGEMKQLLASILATGETKASGGFAGPWAILYKRLIDYAVREELACALIVKLRTISPDPSNLFTATS